MKPVRHPHEELLVVEVVLESLPPETNGGLVS